jgi:hypothetical protein
VQLFHRSIRAGSEPAAGSDGVVDVEEYAAQCAAYLEGELSERPQTASGPRIPQDGLQTRTAPGLPRL